MQHAQQQRDNNKRTNEAKTEGAAAAAEEANGEFLRKITVTVHDINTVAVADCGVYAFICR